MFRVGYKRLFVPKTNQKSNFKRQKYNGSKFGYGNKNYYGKRMRVAGGGGKRFFASRSLKDEVFASEEGILCSKYKGDYVTLPELGQGSGTRSSNRVKVWTINLDGRITFSPVDQVMLEDQAQVMEVGNIKGYVGVFIILDRMPTGASQGIPLFADIFGATPNNVSSLLDQHVRVDQLSRFKVIMRERKYVNTTPL